MLDYLDSRNMLAKTSLLAGLALLSTPPLAYAQSVSPTPACNHRDRETDVVAGDHNVSNVPCFVLHFNVAAQEYTSPDECRSGYAHFPANIYKCDNAVSPNNNCKARGTEVEYHSYTDGGCPPEPDLSNFDALDWDSWKTVPAEFIKATRCTPPKKSVKNDWSAVVTECQVGGEKPVGMSQTIYYLGEGGGYYRYGVGSGETALTGIYNYFMQPYDLAQDIPPSQLPGTLGVVGTWHPSVLGTDSRSTVVIEHFDPADPVAAHTFSGSLVGEMAADGRFDIDRFTPSVSPNGNPTTSEHRTTYDGERLRNVMSRSEFGSEYCAASAEWETGCANFSMLAESLFWWTYDPFELPSFQGQVFEEELLPNGLLSVRRYFDSSAGPYVGREYLLDVSNPIPRPVQCNVYSSVGETIETTVYSDFRVIDADIWRPFTIVKTTFYQGVNAGQPRVRVTFSASVASVMTSDDLVDFPEAFPDTQEWIVWD